VTKSGNWKLAKNKGKYLFNVKSMSKVFRAKYVKCIRKSLPDLDQSFYDKLFKKDWVVFAKRPFGHPRHVIEYLGRYTNKVAISNHRIQHIDRDNCKVTFSLKDYRVKGKKKEMTISVQEFIRRFTLNILPKGFTRIRHYGILSGTWKSKHLAKLQESLAVPLHTEEDDICQE